MEEMDTDALGDAWGADDGLDLEGVDALATDQDGVEELVGATGSDDEEGGWEMEVGDSLLSLQLLVADSTSMTQHHCSHVVQL